jgi:hypothetical protein
MNVTNELRLGACLVKPGILGDVLEQVFANLQGLSNWERPEVLCTLVDKFSPRSGQSFATCPDRRSGRWSKAVKKSNDGSESLPHAGFEATAQYMSSPKPEREFENVAELAKHGGVTRKTIYLWMKDRDVLRRAQYLTSHKRIQGDVIGRREWPAIIQAMTDEAKAGNVAAASFIDKKVWLQEAQLGERGLSLEEMMSHPSNDDNCVAPTGMMEFNERAVLGYNLSESTLIVIGEAVEKASQVFGIDKSQEALLAMICRQFLANPRLDSGDPKPE